MTGIFKSLIGKDFRFLSVNQRSC